MSNNLPTLPTKHFILTETTLLIEGNPTKAEWEHAGKCLNHMEGCMMWWIGAWLLYGEHTWGETYKTAALLTGFAEGTLQNAKWVCANVQKSRRRENLSFSHHQEVAPLPDKQQEELLAKAEKEHMGHKELRRAVKATRYTPPSVTPPEGKYKTIIIDPPWPMEKIQREVRPKQQLMDYPPMSIDQIEQLPIGSIVDPEGTHIYLWTTHKHLPTALKLLETWNVKYQCVLTWVKNVGITPFSWMYSTELVLFGRHGTLPLLVNGKRLDFSAKVREHSRKPDEFYDLVKQVSPGPRLDMFAREQREGFEVWGNETDKFMEKR